MIEFFLNGRRQKIEAAPDMSILELLRTRMGQYGTKEGCASGDCGACTVAIAEPGEDASALTFRSANACITPAHQLQGCHLVTVEGLADGDALHPAQSAMVACHGSQCGFCTPGIVMSLFVLYENQRSASEGQRSAQALDDHRLEAALGGNLCRCTGYRPIRDAARSMGACEDIRPPWADDPTLEARVRALGTEKGCALDTTQPGAPEPSGGYYATPTDLAALVRCMAERPEARLVAGATDLWLETTQRLQPLEALIDVRRVAELRRIEPVEDGWWIGAAVTYRELEPLLQRHYPAFAHLLTRLGSSQIRNRGTLGGNIANASPIGDTPPVLLALDARLRLAGAQGERELPLAEFFLDYKRTALRAGECIAAVFLPRPNTLELPRPNTLELPRPNTLESSRPNTLESSRPNTLEATGSATAPLELRAWKLSKRREDDISTLLGVFRWQRGETALEQVRVAFGGMAAIPLRVPAVEAILEGNSPDAATFDAAKRALRDALTPMSDVRGSREYRLTAACNLLERWRLTLAAENAPTAEVMLDAYAH